VSLRIQCFEPLAELRIEVCLLVRVRDALWLRSLPSILGGAQESI
jgi:hypothetical protein